MHFLNTYNLIWISLPKLNLKMSIFIYFEANLCYRMSQQLHIQPLQILQSEQRKRISSSFFFFCFLTRWDFELKYHNRTFLINASSEIDEIGIIEYSHGQSRFYIHGYTCINFISIRNQYLKHTSSLSTELKLGWTGWPKPSHLPITSVSARFKIG